MTPKIVVKEWQKKNRHRIYFSLPNGADVGWYDLVGHRGDLYLPEYATEYATEAMLKGASRRAVLSIVNQSSTFIGKSIDLSENEAGVAALSQGKRLQKSGAPISEVQNWLLGARGEAKVGEFLKRLPGKQWRVLHSVPIGVEGADIDHLVVGVGGVFAINTKTHPRADVVCVENKVSVRRGKWHKQMPYARNSRFEARRVRDILSVNTGLDVPVRGVVAYFAGSLSVVSPPKDGKVENILASQLVGFLLSQPRVLTEGDVEKIWEVARWSGVWDGSGEKTTKTRRIKK